MHVDDEEVIFKNLSYYERDKLEDGTRPYPAVFYGFPGAKNVARIKRFAKEYAPMVLPELCSLTLLVICAIVWQVMRRIRKKPSHNALATEE